MEGFPKGLLVEVHSLSDVSLLNGMQGVVKRADTRYRDRLVVELPVGENRFMLKNLKVCEEQRCMENHTMRASSTSEGDYATGWACNVCGNKGGPDRWCCETCQYDVCFTCMKGPGQEDEEEEPPSPQRLEASLKGTDDESEIKEQNKELLRLVHRMKQKLESQRQALKTHNKVLEENRELTQKLKAAENEIAHLHPDIATRRHVPIPPSDGNTSVASQHQVELMQAKVRVKDAESKLRRRAAASTMGVSSDFASKLQRSVTTLQELENKILEVKEDKDFLAMLGGVTKSSRRVFVSNIDMIYALCREAFRDIKYLNSTTQQHAHETVPQTTRGRSLRSRHVTSASPPVGPRGGFFAPTASSTFRTSSTQSPSSHRSHSNHSTYSIDEVKTPMKYKEFRGLYQAYSPTPKGRHPSAKKHLNFDSVKGLPQKPFRL